MNLVQELEGRGLVEHTSAPLESILAKPRTVYLGVDPTADSMQAGNLVVVLLLKRLADAGHRVMLLVGGGTGMIGDPKEKGERALADRTTVKKNSVAIKKQMERIIGKKVPVVDNASWLLKLGLVEFLRDIGKHFTVNELVKRDIIRRRLETPDESISYTEFAYSLLQGYDYLHLNRTKGVDLQIGASDQWTNILSGVELIRRKDGKEAFALTCPLVTDASGKKFGKSEGNAVWLDPKKTSPYDFYQFWVRQPDSVVEKYLKMYTFIPLPEIALIVEEHGKNPSARSAQKRLAREVTVLVHGTQEAVKAEKATLALFGDGEIDLSAVPTLTVSDAHNTVIVMGSEGFGISKSEMRRLIEARGVRINGTTVDADRPFADTDFKDGVAILQKGKSDKVLIRQ
jgi:tyrosyl-tRNA synthetase